MKKKSQMSMYVIVGLIVVVLVGIMILGLSRKQKQSFESEQGSNVEFASVKTNIKIYIDSCLEQTTIKAIDKFGLLGSEPQIENYINSRLLSCLDNFKFLIDQNYDVSHGSPISNVRITEEILFVDLTFPITVVRGQETLEVKDFQYKFKAISSLETYNGVLRAGTTLFSEDEDLIITVDEDISITDALGNPVDRVSLKVMDKQFDNLDNNVVIGEVAYEGLPAGAIFDPPLRVTIKIDKNDLPLSYNAEDPKIGWYNHETDLWYTYKSQLNYEEDGNYYYYSAFVDHFSPVALVACGNAEGLTVPLTYNVSMGGVYQSPILLNLEDHEESGIWQLNDHTEPDRFPDGGMHLVPEAMAYAECMFLLDELEEKRAVDANWASDIEGFAEKTYNIEFYEGFPAEGSAEEKCDWMLQDWDNDDDSDYVISEGKVTPWEPAGFFNSGGKFYDLAIGDGKTSTEIDTLVDEFISNVNNLCIASCKEYAMAQLLQEFDESLISGDGIRDGSEIPCSPMPSDEYNSFTSFDELFATSTTSFASCDLTDWGEDINNLEEKEALDNVPAGFDGLTMEWYTVDGERDGFYATPKTYGYPDIETDFSGTIGTDYKNSEFNPDETVGGHAEFAFALRDSGGTCVDTSADADDGQIDAIKLFTPTFEELGVFFDPSSTDVTGIIAVTSAEDPDSVSCSPDDTCVWTLNDRDPETDTDEDLYETGVIQSGLNVIGVRVINTNNLPNAYAQGMLQFYGTGLRGYEDCDSTLQQRINYLCKCKGTAACVWDEPEIECLFDIRGLEGSAPNLRETTLCELQSILAEKDITLPASCMVGEAESEVFIYEENPSLTNGGHCSPSGPVCRGQLNKYEAEEVGCYCGSQPVMDILGDEYIFPEDNYEYIDVYCCNGQLIQPPEGETVESCGQMSSAALRTQNLVPPVLSGEDGNGCPTDPEGYSWSSSGPPLTRGSLQKPDTVSCTGNTAYYISSNTFNSPGEGVLNKKCKKTCTDGCEGDYCAEDYATDEAETEVVATEACGDETCTSSKPVCCDSGSDRGEWTYPRCLNSVFYTGAYSCSDVNEDASVICTEAEVTARCLCSGERDGDAVKEPGDTCGTPSEVTEGSPCSSSDSCDVSTPYCCFTDFDGENSVDPYCFANNCDTYGETYYTPNRQNHYLCPDSPPSTAVTCYCPSSSSSPCCDATGWVEECGTEVIDDGDEDICTTDDSWLSVTSCFDYNKLWSLEESETYDVFDALGISTPSSFESFCSADNCELETGCSVESGICISSSDPTTGFCEATTSVPYAGTKNMYALNIYGYCRVCSGNANGWIYAENSECASYFGCDSVDPYYSTSGGCVQCNMLGEIKDSNGCSGCGPDENINKKSSGYDWEWSASKNWCYFCPDPDTMDNWHRLCDGERAGTTICMRELDTAGEGETFGALGNTADCGAHLCRIGGVVVVPGEWAIVREGDFYKLKTCVDPGTIDDLGICKTLGSATTEVPAKIGEYIQDPEDIPCSNWDGTELT